MIIQPGLTKIEGFVKITDPVSGEILVDKKNAIHYENISIAMAQSLSNRTPEQGGGWIYEMAFGNGGSSVDPTGVITYLPPNTTGQNADLYNETYYKVVDDNSAANTDPSNQFDYGDGALCPAGAHIRRNNPRGAGIVQRISNLTGRLVRRGLSYGDTLDLANPDDKERGLLGNFIGASLGAQVVSREWWKFS
jgi:hypothetical protein